MAILDVVVRVYRTLCSEHCVSRMAALLIRAQERLDNVSEQPSTAAVANAEETSSLRLELTRFRCSLTFRGAGLSCFLMRGIAG
jgi:hypothetical protein